jgi:hypothetical protein
MMGEMSAREDPLQFNVRSADGAWLCPCCGFPQDCGAQMYYEHGGDSGISICPACFWEPGFDDHPGASTHAAPTIKASLLAYRSHWIAQGCRWRAEKLPPAGWNGRSQCKALLRRFPHLGE